MEQPVFEPFSGAKIALLCGNRLIAYKRDDKPGIPYPGLWDLPGGGREGDETPVECALREVAEEFGLRLPPDRVIWARTYPGVWPGSAASHFLAGTVLPEEVAAIRFGDEGQYWRMMTVDEFLHLPDGAPPPPAAAARLPGRESGRRLKPGVSPS